MAKPTRQQVMDDLTELMEAIDRRLPRLNHLEELAIAKEASELRARAADLLAHLKEAVRKLEGNDPV